VKKAISALQEFDGIVEQASEEELADAAAMADRTGMYSCPHTGVALAVLKKLVEKGVVPKEARTIVISTAHGLKFSEFKVGYHEGRLEGVNSRHANRPIELPPDVERVRKTLGEELRKRKM
jgi:threonine synthase